MIGTVKIIRVRFLEDEIFEGDIGREASASSMREGCVNVSGCIANHGRERYDPGAESHPFREESR